MTERKPPGMDLETWVERQIRQATERGEFDNLPGAGKPLPGLGGRDGELWWVKGYLRREGLSTEALLPTPLQLRAQIERLPDTVRDLPSEQAVREVVAALNRRIVDWLRAPSGPPVPVRPVNADTVVARWYEDRRAAAEAATAATASPDTAAPPQPGGWWRRIARRRRKSG